jgi:hypothetical protein
MVGPHHARVLLCGRPENVRDLFFDILMGERVLIILPLPAGEGLRVRENRRHNFCHVSLAAPGTVESNLPPGGMAKARWSGSWWA